MSRRHLLFFEDRVPHSRLGSGYPRSNAIVRAAIDLGYEVTLYPLIVPTEPWHEAYADIPREVELVLGPGPQGLASFLRERVAHHDVILVSRPHNMRTVRDALPAWPVDRRPSLVYDAEAIFALRDIGRRELEGTPVPAAEKDQLVADEISLAKGCDVVVTVSKVEERRFREQGYPHVSVLSHALAVEPAGAAFAERRGMLFVGAVSDDAAPNADSIEWFVHQVLPRLQVAIADDGSLCFVGRCDSVRLAGLRARGFERAGMVDDVQPFFARARVFVAPTRFGAGIPLKVLQAAAFGVPIVCSSLVASQLGWRDGVDLLVADSPGTFADRCAQLHSDEQLWARLSQAALLRVRAECAPGVFRQALADALAAGTGVGPHSDVGSKFELNDPSR